MNGPRVRATREQDEHRAPGKMDHHQRVSHSLSYVCFRPSHGLSSHSESQLALPAWTSSSHNIGPRLSDLMSSVLNSPTRLHVCWPQGRLLKYAKALLFPMSRTFFLQGPTWLVPPPPESLYSKISTRRPSATTLFAIHHLQCPFTDYLRTCFPVQHFQFPVDFYSLLPSFPIRNQLKEGAVFGHFHNFISDAESFTRTE